MIPYARQKTWVDNTGQQVDSAWLNTVEDTLASGFGVTPATNGALVWDGAKFTAAALLKDAQIDPAAAIARSKLNFGSGLVNADIAAAAAIAPSKIGGGYAPNKITVSTLAGGPPGAPSDGDIWIATFVFGGRNYRWQFQYDGVTASSNKWVFVGGSPAGFSSGSAYSNSIAGTYQVPGSFSISPRTGDYVVAMSAVIENSTGGAIEAALAPALNGAQAGSIADLGGIPNGTFATLSLITSLAVVAGQVLDAAYYVSSVAGTHPWSNRSFFVTPTAVA